MDFKVGDEIESDCAIRAAALAARDACEGYDDSAHPLRQLSEKERDHPFGISQPSDGTNKTLLES